MKKTPKMMEVEKKLDEPLEEFLYRDYVVTRRSTPQIGLKIGIHSSNVGHWLEYFKIQSRSISEAKLPVGIKKPTKRQLEGWYLEKRKTTVQIAQERGVSENTINRWLKFYKVPIRDSSEARLPEGIKKPMPDELTQWYVIERKSTIKIAKQLGDIEPSTVRDWLREYDIQRRSPTNARLPTGVSKPTKNDLERWYVNEGKSTYKIAENLGVTNTTVSKWLKQYCIEIRPSMRSDKDNYLQQHNQLIEIDRQFLDFLATDDTARNLAAAAITLNGQGIDFEQILVKIYEGRFKDQVHLHSLLETNAQAIYHLIGNGVTSLGSYLGNFTLGDRRIVPILIGQAIATIPEDKITTTLEERLVRILRISYGPRFNQDLQGTIADIKAKLDASQGKVKRLYEGLHAHYAEVLSLTQELR